MKLVFLAVNVFFVLAFSFSLRIAVIPENPLPGEPVSVSVVGADGTHVVLVNDQGRLAKAVLFTLSPREFIGGNPVKAALLAVPSTAHPGSALIRVENGSALISEVAISIGTREFASEVIPLDNRNTEIRTVSTPQKTAEADRLWSILARTGSDVYTESPFIPPVAATRRTSFFGDRRVYRYSDGKSDTAIHAGIDYGVPTGTPVSACAAGKVVLATFRVATGNSVIIEHLPGVYSLYYHMSVITVREGQMVGGGHLLGESGATGLATGPHLHWEIRVAGENTDPDICVSRLIFDRDELVRRLRGATP